MHNSIAAVVLIILFIYVNNKQKAKKASLRLMYDRLHENFVRLSDGSRLNARIPNEYNVAIYGERWLFIYGCLHYN